jgi:hypothetical protein
MNKKVIIVAVLGLAGVGAYFYFKDKSNTNKILAGQTNDNSLNVPPKGTALSNPEEVVELAKKITDAKALARKINNLRLEKEDMISNPKQYFRGKVKSLFLDNKAFIDSKIKKRVEDFDQQINSFESLIKNLGFKEVNGNAVQIV